MSDLGQTLISKHTEMQKKERKKVVAKLSGADMQRIYMRASNSAIVATKKYIEHNGEQWPCGFAWVVIKPANSRFANYLKRIEAARTSCVGGLSVHNPSKNPTQDMYAKEAGAIAFAKSLIADGIPNVEAHTRMD